MTLDQVIAALVQSTNGAADEALLEALTVGSPPEVARALGGLFQRRTAAGLAGVVERYADLPAELRPRVVEQVDLLTAAVRDVGRAGETDGRLSAVRLVVDARAGQLAHVLSDNLRHLDGTVATAAAAALVTLAEWVAGGVRALQRPDAATAGRRRRPTTPRCAATGPTSSRRWSRRWRSAATGPAASG